MLQRNFKLDKGYGTLRDGINSMISVFGYFTRYIVIYAFCYLYFLQLL